MSQEISPAAQCYGCYDGENIIAMIGVIHFPNRVKANIKTVTRLCVLPEYQGIGIGKKFLDVIADIYFKQGYDIKITTSVKNLIFGLMSSNKWALTRYGVATQQQLKNTRMKKTARKVKTATFFFKGGK